MISEFLANIHLIVVTLVLTVQELQDRNHFSLTRLLLIPFSSILTYLFIQTDSIWIGFILWELVSVLSAFLVLDYKKENILPAFQVLFISLISGAFYLLAISKLPYSASFADLTGKYTKHWLSLAIVAKSGLFPFLWPQVASVAPVRVSASLHSMTSIQLGMYLYFKLPQDMVIPQIIKAACIFTTLFGLIYLVRKRRTKLQLACLTQTTNASILYSFTTAVSPFSIQFHSLYKSFLFLLLNEKNRAGSAHYVLFATVAFLSLFVNYAGGSWISLCNKAFLLFFYMKLSKKLNKTLAIEESGSWSWIGIAVSIIAATGTSVVNLGFKTPSFLELLTCLTLASLMYSLHKFKFREHNELPMQIGNFLIKLKPVLHIIVCILFLLQSRIVGYFNPANIGRLFTSKLQYAIFPIFCTGLGILLKGRDKYRFVIGLNLISIVIAILLFEAGSIEVATTHIVADIITTVLLLNTKDDLYTVRIKLRRLFLLVPIVFVFIVLIHSQASKDLVFPIRTGLSTLNEIVVNWRLADTLGEITTFLLASYV